MHRQRVLHDRRIPEKTFRHDLHQIGFNAAIIGEMTRISAFKNLRLRKPDKLIPPQDKMMPESAGNALNLPIIHHVLKKPATTSLNHIAVLTTIDSASIFKEKPE